MCVEHFLKCSIFSDSDFNGFMKVMKDYNPPLLDKKNSYNLRESPSLGHIGSSGECLAI